MSDFFATLTALIVDNWEMLDALAVAVGVAAAEERVGVGVPATEGDGTGCAEAGPPRANQASPRITSPATTPKAAPSHALPRGCTGLE